MKQKIFDVIQPGRGNSLAGRIFEWTITLLILVSVAVVFAVTFDLPPRVFRALIRVEEFAALVFTVEYLLRIWTADLLFPKSGGFWARLRYVFSPMAIIDLLAILPFWLPMFMPGSLMAFRALRLARLLRLIKLNRYFEGLHSLSGVVMTKRCELLGSLFFLVPLMLISSILMYAVEHEAQPTVFRNAFSGLWWAVATLTTVGYGDIYPVTTLGRILGTVIAFAGIASLAVPTGIITSGLLERIAAEKKNDDPFGRERLLKQLIQEVSELRRDIGEMRRKEEVREVHS